jgi:hypothetical protein
MTNLSRKEMCKHMMIVSCFGIRPQPSEPSIIEKRAQQKINTYASKEEYIVASAS